MRAREVLDVLAATRAAHIPVWLDGGWGVDALLEWQTRQHADLDVVVELRRLDDLYAAGAELGFEMVEDHLPTRAVLGSPDGRRIDIHPVTFDGDGVGWQIGASPDGTDCPYPPEGFGWGRILGEIVPCLTAPLQVEHHLGYRPSDKDRRDMAALAAAFDLDLPGPYSTEGVVAKTLQGGGQRIPPAGA